MTTHSTFIAASPGETAGAAFWERLWRLSGIGFVALFILTCVVYGELPGLHPGTGTLAAFYEGHRTRILIGTALSGLNLLNLLWFVAALRNTLADAGRDGWGAAATVSSAAFGALFLLLISIGAALSLGGSGADHQAFTAGLHDFGWALIVASSFPRAMLIMSAAFGLWRAGLISDTLFAAGVGAVVLGVLGGTTWMSDGIWAPDGAYSRFIAPLVALVWILVVSRVLLTRSPATRSGW